LIQQNTSVRRDLHQISCRGSSTNRRKWFIIICFCLLKHSLFSLHKKQKPSQTKLGAFTMEIQHVACFSYDLFCYLSRRQYWPVSFLHVLCVCVRARVCVGNWNTWDGVDWTIPCLTIRKQSSMKPGSACVLVYNCECSFLWAPKVMDNIGTKNMILCWAVITTRPVGLTWRPTIPWAAQYSVIAGSQTRRHWWLNFKPSLPVPMFGLGVVDLLMLPAAYHVIAE